MQRCSSLPYERLAHLIGLALIVPAALCFRTSRTRRQLSAQLGAFLPTSLIVASKSTAFLVRKQLRFVSRLDERPVFSLAFEPGYKPIC